MAADLLRRIVIASGIASLCAPNAGLVTAWADAAAAGQAEYYAVCDAGSTGTRLYIFRVESGSGRASTLFVKKVKPGLSSYADNPRGAVAPLLGLLLEGASAVPLQLRAIMPVIIKGTAGMRLLPVHTQAEIWRALRLGFQDANDFPFSRAGMVLRTVEGDEEGLWAALTANFLSGRIGRDLRLQVGGQAAVGLLDLGGSSTQIAIPSAAGLAKGNGGAYLRIRMSVQSYLGFGMTRLREQLRLRADRQPDVNDESCYFVGYELLAGRVGIGDGIACRQLLRETLAEEVKACQASRQTNESCLGDLASRTHESSAIAAGEVDFYAVSGFTYAVDFVRWWASLNDDVVGQAGKDLNLNFPRPSLKEIESALDVMCTATWRSLDKADGPRHEYTDSDNLAYRCFQVNYIVVLLGEVYRFPVTTRTITFALQIDGEDLEWPLGAVLATLQEREVASVLSQNEL